MTEGNRFTLSRRLPDRPEPGWPVKVDLTGVTRGQTRVPDTPRSAVSGDRGRRFDRSSGPLRPFGLS